MYKQTLYKVIDQIKPHVIKRLNKSKKWDYGYNKEHDVIVISKTGQIGEVYEIQNLKIALPKENEVFTKTDKWQTHEYPKALKKIKTIFDWKQYPDDFKEKWYAYIDREFARRHEGYWFNNKGKATYITGTHYMYLQWSKIDVGQADFREANRLFYIFWEACKADKRVATECATSKTDGLVFHSWHLVKQSTLPLSLVMLDTVSFQNLGLMLKKMFTDKIVPISVNYPFFFKPIQDGMDRPKTELAYRVPASRFTRRKLDSNEQLEELEGLDTTIDWKNTGDNSYDGEKLKLLVHDESGKWEKPDNILNNWRVTKTCLRLGSRIIGKCMMGSTSQMLLDKGGRNYKKLYDDSDVTRRNRNGQTSSGLYSLFIPMEWNYEGYIDSYGLPVFETPEEPKKGPDGFPIEIGVIEHWENEVDGLKNDPDALNELYRQFPRTEKHAFRDETKQSLFNLTKDL